MVPRTYKPSKTTIFFKKICFIAYIVGFPYLWIENLEFSKRFTKIYNRFNVINNALIFLFLFLQFGAFLTQNNLNKNQRFHLFVYNISTFMYCCFYSILMHYKKTFKKVISSLTGELKAYHNDPLVERQMIRKSLTYLAAITCHCFCTMITISAEGYMETVRNNVPFTTIITAYPDIYDSSTSANMFRVFVNYTWWIFLSRVLGSYMLVTPSVAGLSYQYKNLCSYFYSLSKIIEKEDLTQEQKEEEYEKRFKLGIDMHLDTLRCTRQIQIICNRAFSWQVLMNTFVLVLLLGQMVHSDRNLTNLLATLSLVFAVLFTTGLFMWNAGDITVEASHLSTAIYFSGWHNCRGQCSIRIRKLVSITMIFAQRPVVLKGFGYIEFSYPVFLTIVKSSYSAFSVLF